MLKTYFSFHKYLDGFEIRLIYADAEYLSKKIKDIYSLKKYIFIFTSVKLLNLFLTNLSLDHNMKPRRRIAKKFEFILKNLLNILYSFNTRK